MLRNFQRPENRLDYKKCFLIAAEGEKTERQYFILLGKMVPDVCISCIPRKHSAPEYLLKSIREEGKKLRPGDEAWCVCDTDRWEEKHLKALFEWSKQKENYDLAVSNPKFEFWLLLHFEEGGKVKTAADCDARLAKYLPRYNKDIDRKAFTERKIRTAIDRAKMLDKPRCKSWPKDIRRTTVYRLVEKILAAKATKI